MSKEEEPSFGQLVRRSMWKHRIWYLLSLYMIVTSIYSFTRHAWGLSIISIGDGMLLLGFQFATDISQVLVDAADDLIVKQQSVIDKVYDLIKKAEAAASNKEK